VSTVTEIADRAFREHLHPLDDQPVTVTFAAAATREATSWTFDDATLSPEELDLFAPGVVVEADDGELVLVTDVDYDGLVLTVVRGHLGTTAASHTAGSTITAAPLYGRRLVLEAVKDEVVALYPTLRHVGAVEIVTSMDPVEVPSEVVTPTSVLVVDGATLRRARFTFLAVYPPSATGKAIVVDARYEGLTAYINFNGRFARPTYDSDDVYDFGVQREWEAVVAVGAAVKAAAQRHVDQLSAEYLTEQLERDALPADVAHQIREGLRELRAIYLDGARRAQNVESPRGVVYNQVGAH